MAFNLEDYEPVADRIERFWKDHPTGRITTELVHRDEKSFIVKALVHRKGAASDNEWSGPDSTGYAEEIIGSTNVNRTSALENCETSAIGRALANLGYAVKNRASREEMEKVQSAPRQRSGMKRTPTPPEERRQVPQGSLPPRGTTNPPEERRLVPRESPETPVNGSVSHLTPEQAIQVATIKKDLLARLEGDIAKAAEMWSGTVRNFGLDPEAPLPADMISAVEYAIKGLAI